MRKVAVIVSTLPGRRGGDEAEPAAVLEVDPASARCADVAAGAWGCGSTRGSGTLTTRSLRERPRHGEGCERRSDAGYRIRSTSVGR
jgi:hypothetical protein